MPARISHSAKAQRSKNSATNTKNLPVPPSLWKMIGPSFILLGLALGSGELVLWPYLTATWGLGLLWGGLLGISLQYILNTEAMRYSLARGESVFVGFRKLGWIWPFWFIFSTFLPWALPGFSAASASLFTQTLGIGIGAEKWVTIGLLVFTGVLLSVGRTLYNTMEFLQRTIIILALPIMFGISLYVANTADWQEALWGLIGRGDGWWFFPPGIAIGTFLGAFAYSGAGGNLNLAQSYYVKEKGFGMGAYGEKISSLFSPNTKEMHLSGHDFTMNAHNKQLWKKWWRLVCTEHFLVFYLLGFATIFLMALLSKSLVYGFADTQGIEFLFQEGVAIRERTFPVLGTFFLLSAGLMLLTTQIGVLEAAARIISENILLVFHKPGKRYPLSLWFSIILWLQIILGIIIILIGVEEPRFLLTLGAVLNGAAMMVAFPLLYFLNTKHLPKFVQPRLYRKIGVALGFGFFFLFFCILLWPMIMGK